MSNFCIVANFLEIEVCKPFTHNDEKGRKKFTDYEVKKADSSLSSVFNVHLLHCINLFLQISADFRFEWELICPYSTSKKLLSEGGDNFNLYLEAIVDF